MPNYWSRRQALYGGLAVAGASAAGPAQAAVWPSRQVRIICAYPPGGITDLYARAYGQYISETTSQNVIVENKTGGGGAIAAQALKSAAADGHTLMITISTTLLGNRVIYKNLPYDADKDFAFLSLLSTGHLPLIVAKSIGVRTVAEFVDYARKNKVNFGSYAAGSLAHIICAELNRLYKLDMAVVTYRGEVPMWQDLANGSLQAAVGSYQAANAVLGGGAGVAIAVPTAKRMRKMPDVATFSEQGITGQAFQLMSWVGFLGQAALPAETVDVISSLLVAAGKSERIQKLMDLFGVDDAAIDHAGFVRIYESQGPIWIELVKGLGLTPE